MLAENGSPNIAVYRTYKYAADHPGIKALTLKPASERTPVESAAAVPSVSVSGGGAVTEGGSAAFTVTASPAPGAAITVNVSVSSSGGYATVGTRTVSVGTSGSATLSVATIGDSVDEADGSVTATVTSGTGYTVGSPAAATVAVRDDDVPSVSVSGGSAVTEGGSAVFTVTAAPAPSAAITVNVSVSSSGGYAVAATRTVTIPTSGSATLSVSTIGDSVDEADGSVTATVTSGTGYTVGSSNAATVVVRDDDEPTAPENAAPQVAAPQVGMSMVAGASEEVSLAGVFNDPEGDALSYSAESSNDAVATVVVAADGTSLTVTGVAGGTATITVVAQDPHGSTATDSFDVTVTASALADAVARYDANANGRIETSEYHQALRDYNNERITYEDLLAVVRAYVLNGG